MNVVLKGEDVDFKWQGVDAATKYNVYIKKIPQDDDQEKRFEFVVGKLNHT